MENQSVKVCYPWQLELWQQLTALSEQDHLPQAFLLSGLSGTGKTHFAQAFAGYLLCDSPVTHPDSTSQACGQCRSCQLLRAGTHPDFKIIKPEEGKKIINIGQIRSLIDYLNQTSQRGHRKLTILETAEVMNTHAANALLKSLEEPASSNILLLVTASPSRLPATIRSRCQSLVFPLPAIEKIRPWINDQLPEDLIGDLLNKAQGRPLLAVELYKSGMAEQINGLEADFLSLLEEKASPVSIAEKWKDIELNTIFLWLRNRLHELIVSQYQGVGLGQNWLNIAAKADSRQLFMLDDKLATLQNKSLSGANPNRQLLLEDLILESCEVFR